MVCMYVAYMYMYMAYMYIVYTHVYIRLYMYACMYVRIVYICVCAYDNIVTCIYMCSVGQQRQRQYISVASV